MNYFDENEVWKFINGGFTGRGLLLGKKSLTGFLIYNYEKGFIVYKH